MSRKLVDQVVKPPAIGRLLDDQELPDWRVAALLGIHPTALSLYRSGDRYIHDTHAALLADFFDVSVDVLRGSSRAIPTELEDGVVVVGVPGPSLLPGDDFDPWEDPA